NTDTPVDSTNTVDITPVLDPELELRMCEDYRLVFNFLPPDDIWPVRIQQYFGNFSGWEVVYIGVRTDYPELLRSEQVAGYTLVFPDERPLYVYKDSRFYRLQFAYDAEFITKEDVYNIGKRACVGFPTTPPPYLEVPVLDTELELRIREDFWRFLDVGAYTRFGFDEAIVTWYLGIYSGLELVDMSWPLLVHLGQTVVDVAGYVIVSGSSHPPPWIYKDSMFYTLGEAYESGLITKADVYNVARQIDCGYFWSFCSFTERYPIQPR
ncbi:MAG: hypothetical protein FWF18_03250, partial [Dehalococcoidia bacterium]|nr:hypothetical protein [Dehalococcoidia bacterium]